MKLCFDPRDPTQRAEDVSTWKPSENPALHQASRLLQDGVSPDQVNWSAVIEEAELFEQQARKNADH